MNDDIFFDRKKGIAISVDTFVEGVHFLDSKNPNKFLKKILRASLSDLYCKGIKPKNYFLSFAVNKNLAKKNWFKRVARILKSEQKKFKIYISGGDTTISKKLIITVIVLGMTKKFPVLRKGCSINDDIYVTGNIGDSFLGLNILKKKLNFGKFNSFFIKKYYEPDLQIYFSSFLKTIATSSIDISDGLVNDLKHICTSSSCGALIDINLIPVSKKCRLLIAQKKISIEKIFSNGDDYQIIFTSKYNNRKKINFLKKKTNTKITRIGIITKDRNIMLKNSESIFKLNSKKMGYIHNF